VNTCHPKLTIHGIKPILSPAPASATDLSNTAAWPAVGQQQLNSTCTRERHTFRRETALGGVRGGRRDGGRCGGGRCGGGRCGSGSGRGRQIGGREGGGGNQRGWV
jgi:hypothetical protein